MIGAKEEEVEGTDILGEARLEDTEVGDKTLKEETGFKEGEGLERFCPIPFFVCINEIMSCDREVEEEEEGEVSEEDDEATAID